jgi:hypothetical protein
MAKTKIAPNPKPSSATPDKAIAAKAKAEIIEGLAALRKRADTLIAKWKKPSIETAESFEAAGLGVKDFASLRKDLKATIYPAVAEAKKLYDERRKAYNAVDDILDDAELALRSGLIAYETKHRKAQEARVERALASGKDEKAAVIAAKPYTPEVSGLSFRDVWHGEIVDFKVFLTAILDGRIPSEAVEVNASWLNAKARAEHEAFAIPGAKAVKETITGVRA